MPTSSRRCGMITRREAERLVKSFLDDSGPPQLPDDFVFEVEHRCGWGCRGTFIPSRYNSSRAKCIKCQYCDLYFSPNKFIFHYHRTQSSKYYHPDAANFNSWRRHLHVITRAGETVEADSRIEESDERTEEDAALLHSWEDVKAMFNGGNRRRNVHQNVSSGLGSKIENVKIYCNKADTERSSEESTEASTVNMFEERDKNEYLKVDGECSTKKHEFGRGFSGHFSYHKGEVNEIAAKLKEQYSDETTDKYLFRPFHLDAIVTDGNSEDFQRLSAFRPTLEMGTASRDSLPSNHANTGNILNSKYKLIQTLQNNSIVFEKCANLTSRCSSTKLMCDPKLLQANDQPVCCYSRLSSPFQSNIDLSGFNNYNKTYSTKSLTEHETGSTEHTNKSALKFALTSNVDRNFIDLPATKKMKLFRPFDGDSTVDSNSSKLSSTQSKNFTITEYPSLVHSFHQPHISSIINLPVMPFSGFQSYKFFPLLLEQESTTAKQGISLGTGFKMNPHKEKLSEQESPTDKDLPAYYVNKRLEGYITKPNRYDSNEDFREFSESFEGEGTSISRRRSSESRTIQDCIDLDSDNVDT